MMIVGASQTEFNENVATAFRQGRDLERQGDIPKALQQYEQILEADPFHIATLIQLCDLLLEQDREDDALEFCRTLFGSETHELIADITAFPISEVALLRLAAIYLGAERPEIGRIILEHTARKHPEFIDAAVGLASILHEERNYGAAASVMRKTAEANPDKAELWFDLAQFELRANSITAAVQSITHACTLEPDNEKFWTVQAVVHGFRNDWPAAREVHLKLCTLSSDPDIFHDAASALIEHEEATNHEDIFERMLSLDPENPKSNFLASAFAREMDQHDRAEQYLEKSFQNLKALSPDDLIHVVQLRRSVLSREMMNRLCSEAAEILDDDAERLKQIAFAAHEAMLHELANQLYSRILELDPGDYTSRSLLLETQLSLCKWGEKNAICEDMLREIDAVMEAGQPLKIDVWNLFPLGLDYAQIARAARYKSAEIYQRYAEERARANFTFNKTRRKKIRLGIMLPYSHANSHTAAVRSFVSRHDKSRFELYGYSVSPQTSDGNNHDFIDHFDKFASFSMDEAVLTAQMIYRDDVDILIDTTGHFARHCMDVAALRPAPIILHGPSGFQIIGGAEFYDYSHNDTAYLNEEFASLYVEKPFYMPHVAMPAEMLEVGLPTARRQDFLLPDDCFLFADFNHSCKYDPECFAAWMEILKRTPGSKLLLMEWIPDAKANIFKMAQEQGVDPDRIIFGSFYSRTDHLRRVQLCDLLLDTYYHPGGVTTVDSIIAGTPTVSAKVSFPLPQPNLALLKAGGTPELFVHDLEAYVETAVALFHDPARLQALRQRMHDQRDDVVLLQTDRWVRNLERGYEIIWEKYLAGDEPARFQILDVEDWPDA
ncbi:MAG: hypothetical protein HOM62_02580 [Rhodospirillaceae bacterium]|jgi:protein O-GlcNAc transferase|nr:hypothetical protein [Rhodospirillaceae bacterium]